MSSRKSKSGAGKATKKSIQPARRDLGAHPPTKNPSTSGRNKSKNDKGMLAPDVAHVKGEGTVEGGRDREEIFCEIPCSTRAQPLLCGLKQNDSQKASSPFNQRSSNNQDKAAQIWGMSSTGCPVSSPRQEKTMASTESQVKGSVASELAQTSDTIQRKMDQLQEAFEANGRRTQVALGQMCNSVNSVKVNLEIMDSTLEAINSRLVQFQKGVRTGLKELTVQVGNLASSLAWKSQNRPVNVDVRHATHPALSVTGTPQYVLDEWWNSL